MLYDEGQLYTLKGDLGQAQEKLQEALNIQLEMGNPQDAALTFLSLGDLAFNQAQWDAAERHYTLAQARLCNVYGPTHPVLAQTQCKLGKRYFDAGQIEAGEKYYRMAIEVYQGSGQLLQKAQTYLTLGQAFENLGQQEAAADCYQQALHCQESWDPNATAVLDTLTVLFNLHQRMNRWTEAARWAQKGLNLARNLKHSDAEAGWIDRVSTCHQANAITTSGN